MKKRLSIIAAVVVLIFSAVPCRAEDAPKVSGLYETFWKESSNLSFAVAPGGGRIYVPDMGALYLNPGDEIRLYLPPQAFVNGLGAPLDKSAGLTVSDIREAGLAPRLRVNAGAQALKGLELADGRDGKDMYISIRLKEDFKYTKEMDFEYLISLPYERSGAYTADVALKGRVANHVVEVSAGDTSVDLSGGRVAVAASYIKNINVYLGCGVSMNTSFFEGSRYYGTASVEISEEDAPLLAGYPEVVYAVTLHTIGLKREGRENVSIDLGGRYYAYNSTGEYLGTTDKMLKFSSKYYLSERMFERINMEDGEA